MRRRIRRALPPALLLLAALATRAGATQVVRSTPEELARGADLVLRGRVESVRPLWNDAHTRILTEVAVSVDQSFKGRGSGLVRVVQMGGQLDGVRMTVAGALAWRPGEDVLLMLERSLPDRYRVAGFTQGKYTIERDPATGVEVARAAGLAGAEPAGGVATQAASPARLPLDDLLARLAPAIEEGGRP